MTSLIWGALSGISYALTFIFLRSLSQTMSPLLAATVQMVSISVFLVIACIVERELTPHVCKTLVCGPYASYIIGAGVTGGASWVFYMLALKHGSSAMAGLISDQLSIVLTPLLAYVILHEPLSLLYGISTIFFVIGAFISA